MATPVDDVWADMFRYNLVSMRERRGMTRMELVLAAGVSKGVLSQWERGRCVADLRSFQRLCHALRCKPNELLPGILDRMVPMHTKEVV